jgi:nitrate reductase NapAB chaperone NapD
VVAEVVLMLVEVTQHIQTLKYLEIQLLDLKTPVLVVEEEHKDHLPHIWELMEVLESFLSHILHKIINN